MSSKPMLESTAHNWADEAVGVVRPETAKNVCGRSVGMANVKSGMALTKRTYDPVFDATTVVYGTAARLSFWAISAGMPGHF